MSALREMSQTDMAQWVWATQHPYLYTIIEVSTPTILLMFIAGKLISAVVSMTAKKTQRRT